MYKQLIRPILFLMDPENAHEFSVKCGNLGKAAGMLPFIERALRYEDSRLEQKCFGLTFKNPVGLAAGSDKNCEAIELFSSFGFGFLESVSFAYEYQDGNPRPRIFRLPKDCAIINRLGFPSLGAEKLSPRVKQAHEYLKSKKIMFGINFAKSKNVPLESAVSDYLASYRLMRDRVHYIVINVSSPNTPGLRTLQEKTRLNDILKAIQAENSSAIPVLVKVAPDLTLEELDDILSCAIDNKLAGIVATNTTKSREGITTAIQEEGGMSGRPLLAKSLPIVRHIYKQAKGQLSIIGVGGISSSEDAIQMFQAGADLVELYSALVYEGPGLVKRIKKGLVEHLGRTGMKSIKELVGSGNQ